MKNTSTFTGLTVIVSMNQKHYNRVFILMTLFFFLCGAAPVFSQTPRLGQPTLLQQQLNRLPAVTVAGQTLKFDFGGEVWMAKLNGQNLLAGIIEVHETNTGSILLLKQTHTYAKIAWIKTPGADIILEYAEGPPVSFRTISRSDMDVKLAAGRSGAPAPSVGQAPTVGQAPMAENAALPPIQGYDDEKDFTVEVISEGSAARITKYAGKNTEIRIPPRIGDRPITEIGEQAFSKKGLTSVAIPDSVIFIGNLAFADNRIGSISIGANVYIATNAFDGSGYNPSFVVFYNSQGRRAGTYSNSWRIIGAAAPQPAPQPVRSGSNNAVSVSTPGAAIPAPATQAPAIPVSATPAPATPPDSASSSVGVISPTSGWYANKDNKSSTNVSVGKEQIDGREWDVLTINVNLISGGWAGAGTHNEDIIQKMRNASGVRFKVLGDGKRWRFYLGTSDVTDNAFHAFVISTQNRKVTSVDVPFSRLRQGEWSTKRVAFNKNNIRFMIIELASETGGSSVIKIFDFEIY
jgi:hypothetical protein